MAIRKVIPRSLDSAAASANLSFDANTLFVDSINNVVGINTATPNSFATGLAVYNATNPSVAIVSGNANSYLRLYSTSDSDMYLSNTGGTMTFSTAATSRMTINSSGNVGIGTSSPSFKLHVAGVARVTGGLQIGIDTDINFTGIDNNSRISANSGLGTMDYRAFGGHRFFITHTGDTERMRIDSSGNVGIGTASPSAKLHVAGGSGSTIRNTASAGSSWFIGSNIDSYILHNESNTPMVFTTNSTERMRIDSSGNVGIGTTDTQLFNSTGGTTRLAVCGSSASTDILGNTGASISIINTDTTANNTAGLHFARADTDDAPNYAGASIVAQFPDTQVTGQYPKGLLAFLTSTSANSAPSEKMRIDSSGNVGIGTSSPSNKLEVQSSANSTTSYIRGTGAVPDNNDNSVLYVNHGGTTGAAFRVRTDAALSASQFAHILVNNASAACTALVVDQYGTSPIADFTKSGTVAMRIDTSGNLLVGTTTSSARLTVQADSSAVQPVVFNSTAAGTGATSLVRFRRNGTNVGEIEVTGSATTYATSSDYRLKENIAPMTGALAKVAQLKPVTYKWKIDNTQSQGFIAHELQEVVPECVTGTKDATYLEEYEVTSAVKDEEGKITTPAVMGTRTVPVYQGIDTSFLVATLTAAIQEQQTIITELKARLDAAGL